MPTIKDIEKEIVEEFSLLDGDMEMTINYLMELGDKLPEFPEEQRLEKNIVKGCQSKVWLYPTLQEGKLFFSGDSNTAITKGLVSLLIRVLSGQEPQNIMNAEVSFPQQIGMNRFIGTQRSNGFAAMIKQMKLYAIAYQAKTSSSQ